MKRQVPLADIIILCSLITMFIVRLFLQDSNLSWIQCANFAGMIVAFISLYKDIFSKFVNKKKFAFFTGVFILLILILIVIAILILISVIETNSKFNDCIMIITLLITLPSKLYLNILEKIFNE